MTKLLHSVFCFAVVAFTLGGCDLYFGKNNGGEPGVNPGGGSGAPTGAACTANTDCAAGCSCDNGTCVENGFCSTPSDCADGYTCDDRSTCIPGCSDGNPCPKGQVCDADSKTCQADQETCGGAIDATCNIAPPKCAEHEVPLATAGCYDGNCRAISECNEDAACPRFQYEDDCLVATARCSANYTGLNCKKPDGSACKAGDAGCTCQSFVFAKCEDRTAAGRKVFENPAGVFHSLDNL